MKCNAKHFALIATLLVSLLLLLNATSEAATAVRYLKITLDGKESIDAVLVDSPAATEFVSQLPITLDMTDYRKREKHAHLDFTIAEKDLKNVKQPYEIGDLSYYPPGPTLAIFYDHDGNVISAGIEVIARLDEAGIKKVAAYPDDIAVTIELK